MSSLDHVGSPLDRSSLSVIGRPHLHEVEPRPVAGSARHDDLYRRVLVLSDICAAVGALILLRAIEGNALAQWDLTAALGLAAMAKLLGRYDADRVTIRRSTLDEAPSLVVLAALCAVSWSLVDVPLGVHTHLAGGGVGLLWVLLATLLILTRSLVRSIATHLTGPERVLIVGGADARRALAHSLSTDPGAHLEVVGFLPLEDERRRDQGPPTHVDGERRTRDWSFADLPQLVARLRVDRVLLVPTGADTELMLEAVTRTMGLQLSVSVIPRLFEVLGSAVEFDTVGGVTVLGIRRPGLGRSSRFIKRTMDVLGAGLALALCSPIFITIAVAIKLDTPGPVLFRQRRVGRDGTLFEMLKFRSMLKGAEARREELASRNETVGLFKVANDPRVTRVGRLIRRCSLDELPQLLNVLRGDMSLVGPRPLVIAEDALVQGRHRERLSFAPGMTGPWQVLGPTRPPLAEMVKTDYLYAITWSLWLDIKILLRTISHVRAGRGQ